MTPQGVITISEPTSQWILAFNSSCQKCRSISEAVAEASGGKLEVVPLARPDVVRWRRQSLGPDAPFAPTLIRVGPDAEDVRAWTGIAMAVPLVRRLGLRASAAVVSELGQLKRQEKVQDSGGEGLSRKGFLRLGAGAGVAIGLMMSGQTPSFAESTADVARLWVEENKDRLPQTYDAVVAHPLDRRRAICLALPDEVQQDLWLEQLQRYRAVHPDLLADQVAALDEAAAFISQGMSVARAAPSEGVRLTELLQEKFGKDEARALVGELGPVPPSAEAGTFTVTSFCECNVSSDWCAWFYNCELDGSCTYLATGCGFTYNYSCNGWCR